MSPAFEAVYARLAFPNPPVMPTILVGVFSCSHLIRY
jgi:hypothetical protein